MKDWISRNKVVVIAIAVVVIGVLVAIGVNRGTDGPSAPATETTD